MTEVDQVVLMERAAARLTGWADGYKEGVDRAQRISADAVQADRVKQFLVGIESHSDGDGVYVVSAEVARALATELRRRGWPGPHTRLAGTAFETSAGE